MIENFENIEHIKEYILESNVINLLLVYWTIWFLFFKKFNIIKFLENKVEEVKASIKAAEEGKFEAQNKLKSSEDDLKNIEKVILEVNESYKKIAVSMKEKIDAETVKELENIQEKTQKVVNSEKVNAKNKVTEGMINASVEVAKEYIKNSLTENDHKQLVYDFIDDLDKVQV